MSSSQKNGKDDIEKGEKEENAEGSSSKVDEPEAKRKDINKKVKEIRKIRTIAAIGQTIGEYISEIDKRSVEPGRWITDKIISKAIKNMEENTEINRTIEESVTLVDPC